MVIRLEATSEIDEQMSSPFNRKTMINHYNTLNNQRPKTNFHQRRHSEGEFRTRVEQQQNHEQRNHPINISDTRKTSISQLAFQTPPRPKPAVHQHKCKSTGSRAMMNPHLRDRQFSTTDSNKSLVQNNIFRTPPNPRSISFQERCHSTGAGKSKIFQDSENAAGNSDNRRRSLPRSENRSSLRPVSIINQRRRNSDTNDRTGDCTKSEKSLGRHLPSTGDFHQSKRQNPFEDEEDSRSLDQKPKSLFCSAEKSKLRSFDSVRTSFLPPSETINFGPSEYDDTRDANDENMSQSLVSKRDKASTNQCSSSISNREKIESNHVGRMNKTQSFVIRSSEMEPTLHQIDIPPSENILIHSRVCSLMERYDVLKANQGRQDKLFDFSELIGLSRLEISRNTWDNAIISNLTPEINDFDLRDTTSPLNQKLPNNKDKGRFHPSVVKALFECTEDLVVEGYFQSGCSFTGSQERRENTRIQASVFSSHKHRQFIVCFRGSIEEQAKPISKSKTNQQLGEKESLLHPNQPVSINPKFRETYFTKQIENQVFRLLTKLSDFNPFNDVVMTGHSYGGALATIGAIRFAALFPMMTVSCHAFGAPKVGGIGFRHFANSLPNLKIIRIEHGSDPYVHLPEGKSKWMHVGHTITIESLLTHSSSELSVAMNHATKQNTNTTNHNRNHPQTSSSNSNTISTPTKISNAIRRNSLKRCSSGGHTENSGDNHGVLAYRFDEKRPEKTFWTGMVKSLPKKSAMAKRDHQIKSYIHALDRYTQSKLPWVTQFVGEEGKGVSGADDEIRCVV